MYERIAQNYIPQPLHSQSKFKRVAQISITGPAMTGPTGATQVPCSKAVLNISSQIYRYFRLPLHNFINNCSAWQLCPPAEQVLYNFAACLASANRKAIIMQGQVYTCGCWKIWATFNQRVATGINVQYMGTQWAGSTGSTGSFTGSTGPTCRCANPW